MRDTPHWLLVTLRISYRCDGLAGGAFLVAPLRTCCNFPAFDPFAFLLLARYWHFVLLLQRHPFSVVCIVTYNGLPVEFRLILKNNESALCRLLKLRCDYLNKLRFNCSMPFGVKSNENERT